VLIGRLFRSSDVRQGLYHRIERTIGARIGYYSLKVSVVDPLIMLLIKEPHLVEITS
jgi:hypothetical protein